MKKNLAIIFSVIILTAFAGLGVRFVFAQLGWEEPTDTPPYDNEIPLWVRVGDNLYHTTGGNVGIGTTSPASKLEVVNSSAASDVYGIKTAASSSYGGYERIYGIYSTASAAPYSGGDFAVGVYGGASSTRGLPVGVYGSGGIRGRGVQGTGKVGVYGYAYGIAGGTGVFAWGDTYGLEAAGDYAVYATGNNYGIFSDSGKNYFSGNVGIGVTSPLSKLTIPSGTTGKIDWNQRGNIVQDASFNFFWSTNGVANAFTLLSASGNVGIGTTSPNEKLVVKNGNAYISGKDNGLILRDPNGQCRKITVDSAGALKVSAAFTCPDVAYLVNGIHDTDACSSAGGAVVDDGTGNKMCRFSASSCPSGWTQYGNWSTTSVTDIHQSKDCGNNFDCTTGSHAWGNIGRESATDSYGHRHVAYCHGHTGTCLANITEVGCY